MAYPRLKQPTQRLITAIRPSNVNISVALLSQIPIQVSMYTEGHSPSGESQPSTILVTPKSAMRISYKKLWKMLIDREMKKKDLAELAGISTTSIAKLGKNDNVNTDILLKICKALKCDISEIMGIERIEE